MPSNRNKGARHRGSVKFGRILAVGMTVALIWGIILMIVGIYVRFKFGTILSGIIGNINDEVNTKSSMSPYGQDIAPVGTIADDVNLGTWPKLLGALFISSSILTMLFSCLGVYAGLNHNKLVLIVTVVILIVTAFLLLGLISIMADTESSFHVEAKNELVDMLQSDYTVETATSSFVFAMNSMMFWFHCCGISGVRDFHNLTYREISEGQGLVIYNFKVAPACCHKNLYNIRQDPMTNYMRIKDCATRGYTSMDALNKQGCYNIAFKAVQGTISALLAIILIWNVLVLVLAILTIMEAKQPVEVIPPPMKEEEVVERKVVERAREDREVVIKKFIPYAKITSFTHPDITRIKSTEIW